MEKIALAPNLEVSRIIHGQWRLLDWKLTDSELLRFIEQVVELGITTFDHADIYGDYECEQAFGKAIKEKSSIRDDIYSLLQNVALT